MMAYKHLHELLKEDQEPFQLKNYISEKRCQLKRANNPQTTLHVKKRKPVITQKSKHSFCKHACFLSFQDSPDFTKSPFFDFPSPAQKSKAVLLHVPAGTGVLLFEAAMRVRAQKNSRGKTELRSSGFGFLGSVLKKLKDRNKNKKKEIGKTNIECVEEEVGVTCHCNNSRVSSAGWSESNEEKSLDLMSSCSSRSEESLEEAFAAYEKRFCATPPSPFQFSLRTSPSAHQTPDFSSPEASPSRRNYKKQEQTEGSNMVLEDEKEQCSPVSVLETLFEIDDDDEGQDCGDKDEYEDEDTYYYDSDNECNGSFAIVQKAKEQLLDKLRRFEKLAALDPIELEKRMMEEMEDQDDERSSSLGREIDNLDAPMLTAEVLRQASFQQSWKFQKHMESLVSDLISEEKKETNGYNGKEVMARRICQKLNSWKEVKPQTIEMMVQLDLEREYVSWKYQEQCEELAGEIEVSIFKFLVDELAEELCC